MVFDRENSDFFASQANKVQQNSWLNVLSGMVSHKCLKANLTNSIIANFRVGVCNNFHESETEVTEQKEIHLHCTEIHSTALARKHKWHPQ